MPSSSIMTMLGLAAFILSTAGETIPPEAPWWLRWIVISLAGGISLYLGWTHPGRPKKGPK